MYNPKVPKTLDISLIHQFNHESVVCCVRYVRILTFVSATEVEPTTGSARTASTLPPDATAPHRFSTCARASWFANLATTRQSQKAISTFAAYALAPTGSIWLLVQKTE